jgi:hypothetical protein
VKYFQQYLIESGVSICTRNQTMTGVKFLLRVTLRRHDLVAKRQLHPPQVSTWKRQAIESIFSNKFKKLRIRTVRSKSCMPRLVSWRWRIFFVTRAQAVSPSKRHEMIRKENTKPSLTRQCKRFCRKASYCINACRRWTQLCCEGRELLECRDACLG